MRSQPNLQFALRHCADCAPYRRTGRYGGQQYAGHAGAGKRNGFLFDEAQPLALLNTIWQALRLYRDDPDGWRRLATTGMTQDFSWEASARQYLQLYSDALAERQQAVSA
nr:hypothetical protein [Chromatium okenii]